MQTSIRAELLSKIAELTPASFETTALAVFRYQAAHNPLYARYLELLRRDPPVVTCLAEIPFLPIALFKRYAVQTGEWAPAQVFTSSGTTGQTTSRHLVRDPEMYLDNTRRGFAQFYGDPAGWCFLALLPSYLERAGSSLVAMADYFIGLSRYPESGFFLNELDQLQRTLRHCRAAGIPTVLLGVSFALLDFAEQYPMDLSGVLIMETGGMKGRRRELTRSELHQTLQQAFQVSGIHSEYGMTELFSQAYSQPVNTAQTPAVQTAFQGLELYPEASGSNFVLQTSNFELQTNAPVLFSPAPTMQVLTTETNDPFCPAAPGRSGVLNIVDLANLDTCSFIAAEDVGKVYADGRFEVLGRLDAAEMRGCNLMIE